MRKPGVAPINSEPQNFHGGWGGMSDDLRRRGGRRGLLIFFCKMKEASFVYSDTEACFVESR